MQLPWTPRARRRRAIEAALATPDPGALLAAAGLGASAGLRAATPLAVLQLRGLLFDGPLGSAVVAGAAVEWIIDKLPIAGPRTAPASLLGRMVSGGVAGAVVGGTYGAAVAAATSVVTAFAGMHARAAIVQATGLPDGAVATVEDLVAAALATAATSTAALS